MASLVAYALKLTAAPDTVVANDLEALRAAGLDDRAVVDANQVVSYFNYVNRIADGLGVELESTWPSDLRDPRRYALAACSRIPVAPESSFPVLDLAQAREMDRLMVEEMGIPLERMMENAGRAVAAIGRARLGGSVAGSRVTVYAGRGGNGGGGLVAARHLANAGAQVGIVTVGSAEELAPTTRSQLQIAIAMGIPCTPGEPPRGKVDLIVDALHGYSLRGDPRAQIAAMIAGFDAETVVSVDVPSGLEVATGSLRHPHVRAHATVSLASPKFGTNEPTHRGAVGDLYVADISVPRLVFERLGVALAPDAFDRGSVVRVARE